MISAVSSTPTGLAELSNEDTHLNARELLMIAASSGRSWTTVGTLTRRIPTLSPEQFTYTVQKLEKHGFVVVQREIEDTTPIWVFIDKFRFATTFGQFLKLNEYVVPVKTSELKRFLQWKGEVQFSGVTLRLRITQ